MNLQTYQPLIGFYKLPQNLENFSGKKNLKMFFSHYSTGALTSSLMYAIKSFKMPFISMFCAFCHEFTFYFTEFADLLVKASFIFLLQLAFLLKTYKNMIN